MSVVISCFSYNTFFTIHITHSPHKKSLPDKYKISEICVASSEHIRYYYCSRLKTITTNNTNPANTNPKLLKDMTLEIETRSPKNPTILLNTQSTHQQKESQPRPTVAKYDPPKAPLINPLPRRTQMVKRYGPKMSSSLGRNSSQWARTTNLPVC
jgi:hypothetical protein